VDITIRDMRQDDIERVMAIEKSSFPTPWSRRLFEEELDREFSDALVACGEEGLVLGYAVCWTVAGESHLLNIATGPEARRKGVARALLHECVRRGAAAGAKWIHLEVRPGNTPALRLYKSEGFECIGIRKQYYTDTGEDALLFARRIGADETR
jgi:ribosomal-protein-alanine N-acetyltransferase